MGDYLHCPNCTNTSSGTNIYQCTCGKIYCGDCKPYKCEKCDSKLSSGLISNDYYTLGKIK